MAFAEWTYSVVAAGGGDPVSPGLDSTVEHIEAVKSLFFQNTATPGTSPLAVVGWTAGTTGNDIKIQSTMRWVANHGDSVFGVFLQMQSSISYSSDAYFMVWDSGNTTLEIHKGTAAEVQATTSQVLSTTAAPGSMVNGSIYSLALQCHFDSLSSTMFLEGSVDSSPIASPNSYDFSTCTPIFTYADASTPLSSGITAGVMFCNRGSAGSPSDNWGDFDITQIYIP